MRNTPLKKMLLHFVNVASVLNALLPKSKRILFFSTTKDFNDNNRALFEYCVRQGINESYTLYYASPTKNAFLPAKNVHYVSLVRGIFLFLFSKYVFYEVGTTKITPSKRQTVVQMWHGTPLKRLGRDVSGGARHDRFDAFSFAVTTSMHFIPVFSEVFECPQEKIKVMGYPRNDFLFQPADVLPWFQKRSYKTNILWMPTFRRSYHDTKNVPHDMIFSVQLFEDTDILSALNDLLRKKDFFLVIKLHPADIMNEAILPDFSNIAILNSECYRQLNVLNYSFVANFDVLITDYSSVYFDWLLLDRPLAFVIEDIDAYAQSRGFTFEKPLDYMPGEIIRTQEQFYDFLEHIGSEKDGFADFRHRIRDFTHTKIQSASACKALLEEVGIVR